MDFARITSSLEVVVASHADPVFFQKIRVALEDASSVDLPIFVKDFYTSHMKVSEIIDCCGFILIHEVDNFFYERLEHLSETFAQLLLMMAGKEAVLATQRVILLHHTEAELLDTLCDSFDVSAENLYREKKDMPLRWFSLAEDYIKSRYRRRLREQQFRSQ